MDGVVILVALLILLGVYVIVKFLLSKVESLAPLAEILGVIAGILAALIYVGVL